MIPPNSAPKIMSLVRPRVGPAGGWFLSPFAPPGLGATQPLLHEGTWYARERVTMRPMRYVAFGFGQPSGSLISAAQAVFNQYNNGGCPAGGGVVSAFQTAYNAEYSPAIAVDDLYGTNTMSALDQVISDSPAGTFSNTAPPGCVGQASGGGGGSTNQQGGTTSGGGTSTTTPASTTGTNPPAAKPTDWTPWIIGGAVLVGGGLLAWTMIHKT